MRALSLWQPWASLIAVGEKEYETRSWSTLYRGPIAIHAAKSFTLDQRDYCRRDTFRNALHRGGILEPLDLPLGCMVCLADLVGVIRVEKIRDQLSPQELAFGDYSNGRFAWKLVNVRRLQQPLAWRGAQGLFDCVLPRDLEFAG